MFDILLFAFQFNLFFCKITIKIFKDVALLTRLTSSYPRILLLKIENR